MQVDYILFRLQKFRFCFKKKKKKVRESEIPWQNIPVSKRGKKKQNLQFPFLWEEESELFEEANYGSWDQYSIKNRLGWNARQWQIII